MKNKKVAIISFMAMATACAISAATATNATLASAAGEDVFHELGASVRVSSDKGIRFAFGLPEDKTGEGARILYSAAHRLRKRLPTNPLAPVTNIVCIWRS